MDNKRFELLGEWIKRIQELPSDQRLEFIRSIPQLEGSLRVDLLRFFEREDTTTGVPTVAAVREWVEDLPEPKDELVPGYDLLELIGEGGMGVVYAAQQQSPNRKVAIKLVKGGEWIDPLRLSMFRQEIQLQGNLDHPCIAQIIEAGQTQSGRPFFAMEFVEGEAASEFAATHPDMAWEHWLPILIDLCNAVDFAHNAGVFHGDLKPSNMVIRSDSVPGSAYTVKVLDFGLATTNRQDLQVSQLAESAFRGTLAYMSPEHTQSTGATKTRQSDIYSLGVTVYELLAGGRPYELDSEDWLESQRTIRERPPIPLRRHQSGIPADLETVVMKALEKAPDDRYASAREFAKDLARVLRREPILARPPTLGYVVGRWMQRNPFLSSASAGLVLAAGILLFLLADLRAEKEVSSQRLQDNIELVEVFLLSQDKLFHLPGSREVRKLLSEEAVKYLNRLRETEGVKSRETLIILARGYFRLGILQGGLDMASEGQSGSAKYSFDSSVEFWKMVEKKQALTREEHQSISESYLELAKLHYAHGEVEAGMEKLTLSSNHLSEAHGNDPMSTTELLHFINVEDWRSNFMEMNSDATGAIAVERESLRLALERLPAEPENEDLLYQIAVTELELARLLMYREAAEARTLFKSVEARMTELLKNNNPHVRYASTLALCLSRMSMMERISHQWADALPYALRELDIREDLSQADPGDRSALRAYGTAFNEVGRTQIYLNELESSERNLSRSEAIARELHEHDPQNLDYLEDLAVVYDLQSQLKTAQGNLKVSTDLLKKTVHFRKDLVDRAPGQAVYSHRLCIAHFRHGLKIVDADPDDMTIDWINESIESLEQCLLLLRDDFDIAEFPLDVGLLRAELPPVIEALEGHRERLSQRTVGPTQSDQE